MTRTVATVFGGRFQPLILDQTSGSPQIRYAHICVCGVCASLASLTHSLAPISIRSVKRSNPLYVNSMTENMLRTACYDPHKVADDDDVPALASDYPLDPSERLVRQSTSADILCLPLQPKRGSSEPVEYMPVMHARYSLSLSVQDKMRTLEYAPVGGGSSQTSIASNRSGHSSPIELKRDNPTYNIRIINMAGMCVCVCVCVCV